MDTLFAVLCKSVQVEDNVTTANAYIVGIYDTKAKAINGVEVDSYLVRKLCGARLVDNGETLYDNNTFAMCDYDLVIDGRPDYSVKYIITAVEVQ